MIIQGEWRVRPGGEVARPVVKAFILGTAGEVVERWFLVDSGADRTAFCRDTLDELAGSVIAGSESGVSGVGGTAAIVFVQATLAFRKEDGEPATVSGPYWAFLTGDEHEEDILGRDVTNNFVAITDYPARRVLLLGGAHGYAVTAPSP